MNQQAHERTGCGRVRARLDELIDGGLDAQAAARDEGHLEACGACAAERALRERWLAELVIAAAPSNEELEQASRGLADRLAAARAPARRRLALAGGGARSAVLAVSAAAGALVALTLLRGLVSGDPMQAVDLASSLHAVGREVAFPTGLAADPWSVLMGR